MSQLRFVQLSDTHIRKDYLTGPLQGMFTSLVSPEKKLRGILAEIRKEELDFVVISGDLVHEGSEADYQQLKTIIEEADFRVPVLLALGNHDKKEAFCHVFGLELMNGRYYYFYQIREWKIIVLDSADTEHGMGEIDEEQIKWLEQIYNERDEILVFMHHPLFWNDSLLQIGKNRKRLIEILARPNVRGVFCGHVHRNSIREQEQICQFTVESSACGFDYDADGILERERSGYFRCVMEAEKIEAQHCFWGLNETYQIPGDVLKSVLNKKE